MINVFVLAISATFLINIAKFLNLKFKCGAIMLANMLSTKYASNDSVESIHYVHDDGDDDDEVVDLLLTVRDDDAEMYG